MLSRPMQPSYRGRLIPVEGAALGLLKCMHAGSCKMADQASRTAVSSGPARDSPYMYALRNALTRRTLRFLDCDTDCEFETSRTRLNMENSFSGCRALLCRPDAPALWTPSGVSASQKTTSANKRHCRLDLGFLYCDILIHRILAFFLDICFAIYTSSRHNGGTSERWSVKHPGYRSR